MLQVRDARKRRNPPVPTVPRPISVPKSTNVSIGSGVYMSTPWSKNYNNSTSPFAGKDIKMYTFTIPTWSYFFYDFYGTSPFTCYVYSSNDLTTPRTTTHRKNTLHGDTDTDKLTVSQYVSEESSTITYKLEVPVYYWGPHDADAKLSISVSVINTLVGSISQLVSPQFAAMVAN